jgi:predicted RecB family nuclease
VLLSEVEWHLTKKCIGCQYLPFCQAQAQRANDLSLLRQISPQTKKFLTDFLKRVETTSDSNSHIPQQQQQQQQQQPKPKNNNGKSFSSIDLFLLYSQLSTNHKILMSVLISFSTDLFHTSIVVRFIYSTSYFIVSLRY